MLVGVSSQENVQRIDPCCTFRGSLTALDKRTGERRLEDVHDARRTAASSAASPAPGSSTRRPSDVEQGLVYVGTNSHNSAPHSVADCLGGNLNGLPPNLIDHWSESCFPPGDFFSSVLALDLRTGQVRWRTGSPGRTPGRRRAARRPPSWCADPLDITQWDVLGSGGHVDAPREPGIRMAQQLTGTLE